MNKLYFLLVGLVFTTLSQAQNTAYEISFPNATHHEAEIQATYSGLKGKNLEVRMSRTSPGRYAIHEFAKNVFNVKAIDGSGKTLEITRKDPYSWEVLNHNGTVKVSYTLFGDRGDGTYSQIDETHAHLNIPATFMYAPELATNTIQVHFSPREDFGWKVATQLKKEKENHYSAPNLQYFMDSPTEISNYSMKSFDVDGKTVSMVLHHNGTQAEFDEYFEKVKKVVLEEKKVFGELANYDFGTYTFLACYIPNASGDGMEHRNSTILTTTRSLADGGMNRNIGTVSHEFFHSWNVERIRPKSLEPFNFEAANMSGELWFAEGFTSYYTDLILCRAGLISANDYVTGLSGTFNYVWNSPSLQYFNVIEMSMKAPFVDAASSIDPTNWENTFVSYYSYGSVLGLALDLSLREKGLNLDDYMKQVWNTFGKTEKPYTLKGLQEVLTTYAGSEFANDFFSNYVYMSKMPDYTKLFASVGVTATRKETKGYAGVRFRGNTVAGNPQKGTPVYDAGLNAGDNLLKADDIALTEDQNIGSILENKVPGDVIKITFERNGEERETMLTLGKNPAYSIEIDSTASKKALKNRTDWLKNE